MSWLPLTAALAGFVAGVVFWHFVGFWGFVHEAVLKGRAETARMPASEPETTQVVEADTGQSCTLLRADRAGGRATLLPCADLSAMTEAAARRWAAGEFVGQGPAVAGWSAIVNDDVTHSPRR